MYDRTNWPRSSFWLTFQSFHVCVFVWRAMEIPNIFFQNFISFMEIPPNEITKVTKTPIISLYNEHSTPKIKKTPIISLYNPTKNPQKKLQTSVYIYIYNLYIPPKKFPHKKISKDLSFVWGQHSKKTTTTNQRLRVLSSPSLVAFEAKFFQALEPLSFLKAWGGGFSRIFGRGMGPIDQT